MPEPVTTAWSVASPSMPSRKLKKFTTATIHSAASGAPNAPERPVERRRQRQPLEPAEREHDGERRRRAAPPRGRPQTARSGRPQPDHGERDGAQQRPASRGRRARTPRAPSAPSAASAIATPPPRGTTVWCDERGSVDPAGRGASPPSRSAGVRASVSAQAITATSSGAKGGAQLICDDREPGPSGNHTGEAREPAPVSVDTTRTAPGPGTASSNASGPRRRTPGRPSAAGTRRPRRPPRHPGARPPARAIAR